MYLPSDFIGCHWTPEIGPEGASLEKEHLHLLFESFTEYIKREVRKQAVSPKTPQESIFMLARLRPSIQAQLHILDVSILLHRILPKSDGSKRWCMYGLTPRKRSDIIGRK